MIPRSRLYSATSTSGTVYQSTIPVTGTTGAGSCTIDGPTAPQPGEVITFAATGDSYMVIRTDPDIRRGQIKYHDAQLQQLNDVVTIARLPADRNDTSGPHVIATVPAYVRSLGVTTATAQDRSRTAAKYAILCASVGVQVNDRVSFAGDDYRVVGIEPLVYVVRLTVVSDYR